LLKKERKNLGGEAERGSQLHFGHPEEMVSARTHGSWCVVHLSIHSNMEDDVRNCL